MIRILLYRGKSLVSRAIELQTRSPYSHAAAMLDDNTIIEAWHLGGVSHVDTIWTNHTRETPIDIFRVEARPGQQAVFEAYLVGQVGKPYDFRSVFRFLSHTPARENGKWFCSELVTAALDYAGVSPLLRVKPSEVSPGMPAMSPLLEYTRSIL